MSKRVVRAQGAPFAADSKNFTAPSSLVNVEKYDKNGLPTEEDGFATRETHFHGVYHFIRFYEDYPLDPFRDNVGISATKLVAVKQSIFEDYITFLMCKRQSYLNKVIEKCVS